MNKFFILIFLNMTDTIDVPYLKDAEIVLDGKLTENFYESAFKTNEFIQTHPVPFQNPPESTVLYIFQNEKGLVIGLRCFVKEREPDRSSMGDAVWIFLDTYLDRENSYMLMIYANGSRVSARVSSGGEKFDFQFNFLWEGKTYSYKDYFDVEIFVPWKGIMGKKGKWGIDIVRTGPNMVYEARLSPYDPFKEKFSISRFKIIKMVNYSTKLVTTEIQPIFLMHHGEDFGEKYKFKSDVGSNLYFKVGENIKFAFTFNPDFGEVEADPFRLNLTKYPLFYPETRPFFTEGSEFFKLSGCTYFFDVFHSRQIGKTLPSGKVIPILFADKFFIKSKFFEFSFLHSQTEESEDEFISVPRTDFLVSKIKILPERNFSLSLLNAHKLPYGERTRGLTGSQVFYTDSITTFNLMTVFDNYVSKDFAHKINYAKNIKNLNLSFEYLSVPIDFSDNEVGFIPQKGEKRISSSMGYNFLINKKILYFNPSIDFNYGKELFQLPEFSIFNHLSFTFKNLTNLSFIFGYKKDFEMGNKITSPAFTLFISNLFSTTTKNMINLNIEVWASKIYNYNRNYIGWANTNNLTFIFNFKNLTFLNEVYQWNEFNPENKLEETSYSIRTNLGINLGGKIIIRLYSHIPLANSRVLSERIGISITFNPSGKNNLKGIYNDYRVKDENIWQPYIRKTTTKLIHSFYF